MSTVTLAIEGMTCGHCVAHVESALRGLDGISSVEVVLREGRAIVSLDPSRATPERLIAAVDEAGYKARVAPP
jgi:copper ion binding protein